MEIRIQKITKEEWKKVATSAHIICFGEKLDPDFERIDFALLAFNPENLPMGYISVKEFNATHIYWAWGGTFPGTKNSLYSYRCYQAASRWCAERYDSVFTFCENTNLVMLKFSLKLGFRIVGIKHVYGKTYLELLLNLKEIV